MFIYGKNKYYKSANILSLILYTCSTNSYTIIYFMLKPDNKKPFPIRLGELKPFLQKEALEQDRSLHNWIIKILKSHIEEKKNIKQAS